MKNKSLIWEDKFSDNFKPNFLERIIQKLEVSRSEIIISLLSEKKGVVLDLACGSGDTLFKIAPKFTKVIGIDIAKNRIESSKEKSKKLSLKNTIFIHHDIDKGLPQKRNSIDFVICEASLSYFYDLPFIISEVHRILKPKGKFIIEVPNYSFITRRLSLLFGKMPKTSSFPGWGDGGALHYFTHETLKQLLKENKFKVVGQTNSGVLPHLRKIYPELLAGDIIYICKKQK